MVQQSMCIHVNGMKAMQGAVEERRGWKGGGYINLRSHCPQWRKRGTCMGGACAPCSDAEHVPTADCRCLAVLQ